MCKRSANADEVPLYSDINSTVSTTTTKETSKIATERSTEEQQPFNFMN